MTEKPWIDEFTYLIKELKLVRAQSKTLPCSDANYKMLFSKTVQLLMLINNPINAHPEDMNSFLDICAQLEVEPPWHPYLTKSAF